MTQQIIFRAMIGLVLGALVILGAYQQAEDKMEGVVRSVDAEAGMVTLSDGKQLAVDPATRVRKDGSVASLSDIKEGDSVQASFSPNMAWFLGHKDTLQEKVKQVSATSHAAPRGPM